MSKRNFLIIVAVMLATAVLLVAGDKKEHFAKLKTDLNLSDAQVTQLQQKFDEFHPVAEELGRRQEALHAELVALKKSPNPDQQSIEAKHAELVRVGQEMHEKKTAILRSVLTQEQFAKLEKMSAAEHEGHGDHEHNMKEHHDKMI